MQNYLHYSILSNIGKLPKYLSITGLFVSFEVRTLHSISWKLRIRFHDIFHSFVKLITYHERNDQFILWHRNVYIKGELRHVLYISFQRPEKTVRKCGDIQLIDYSFHHIQLTFLYRDEIFCVSSTVYRFSSFCFMYTRSSCLFYFLCRLLIFIFIMKMFTLSVHEFIRLSTQCFSGYWCMNSNKLTTPTFIYGIKPFSYRHTGKYMNIDISYPAGLATIQNKQ